jgi:peptidoglycan/LPS O-acetylase OafA/YrhL
VLWPSFQCASSTPACLSGGFVGVDVFFVISGYLMASMIGQALSDETFSFIDFYE